MNRSARAVPAQTNVFSHHFSDDKKSNISGKENHPSQSVSNKNRFHSTDNLTKGYKFDFKNSAVALAFKKNFQLLKEKKQFLNNSNSQSQSIKCKSKSGKKLKKHIFGILNFFHFF